MTHLVEGDVSDSAMIASVPHGSAMEPSPFLIPSRKLTMWLFIVADAATFGGLLFGYGFLRVREPELAEAIQLFAEHHHGPVHDA